MNLDEALAVYLYLKDQYMPSMEKRLLREEAWLVICEHAIKRVKAGMPTPTILSQDGEQA